MPKTESKTLDKPLIEQALKAFKTFYGEEPVIIPPHLYDAAQSQRFNLKGFTRRCPQKVRHGNGLKRLAVNGQKRKGCLSQKFLQKQEAKNTNQITNESKIVFIGCIRDVRGPKDHAAFLAQLKDLRTFAMRWGPYRRMLVKHQ